MKLNIEELAREAGFVQIMRHKDGSSTVLPTPMFERFARLIVDRCAQECASRISGGLPITRGSSDFDVEALGCARAIRNLMED